MRKGEIILWCSVKEGRSPNYFIGYTCFLERGSYVFWKSSQNTRNNRIPTINYTSIHHVVNTDHLHPCIGGRVPLVPPLVHVSTQKTTASWN